PAEVCILRPVDIDMKEPTCWVYRPERHKTEHHDRERLVLIGPRAQEVLRPYLGTRVDAYCFSPARSESQRNAERRAARVTPMTPSQARRRLHPNRKRPHRDRYDTTTYRRAVHRACARANRKAVEAALRENPGLPPDAVLVPKWSPNQLRHYRAT